MGRMDCIIVAISTGQLIDVVTCMVACLGGSKVLPLFYCTPETIVLMAEVWMAFAKRMEWSAYPPQLKGTPRPLEHAFSGYITKFHYDYITKSAVQVLSRHCPL